MRILLVRHGVTDWNLKRIVQGEIENPLNEMGIKQIEYILPFISKFRIHRIFCSPILRVIQSAEIISLKLSIEKEISKEFTEFKVPEWAGKSVSYLEKNSQSWKEYKMNPISMDSSNGETIYELQNRVYEEYLKIERQYFNKNVIIVSHAEVIRVLIVSLLNIPLEKILSFKISPGSLSIISKINGKYKLEILNFNSTLK